MALAVRIAITRATVAMTASTTVTGVNDAMTRTSIIATQALATADVRSNAITSWA
jgi:hypothetical protein